MEVTLKNLKVHKDMSEETLCFSASIYIDGKKSGRVSNRGHGGPHMIHFDDPVVAQRFTAWADAQDLPFDFEKDCQIIDNILNKMEEEKQYKTWCRSKICFRLKGDEVGEWRNMGYKGIRKMTTAQYHEVRTAVVEKYGDKVEEILNDRFDK
jgi:hypothetical protein